MAIVSSRKNDEKQWGGYSIFRQTHIWENRHGPEETGAGVWSRILKWLLLGGAVPVQVYSSSSKCVYVYYIIMYIYIYMYIYTMYIYILCVYIMYVYTYYVYIYIISYVAIYIYT